MFCKNCGTQLKEGAKFCPKCGTPVTPMPGAGQAGPGAGPQPPYQQPGGGQSPHQGPAAGKSVKNSDLCDRSDCNSRGSRNSDIPCVRRRRL